MSKTKLYDLEQTETLSENDSKNTKGGWSLNLIGSNHDSGRIAGPHEHGTNLRMVGDDS